MRIQTKHKMWSGKLVAWSSSGMRLEMAYPHEMVTAEDAHWKAAIRLALAQLTHADNPLTIDDIDMTLVHPEPFVTGMYNDERCFQWQVELWPDHPFYTEY